MLADIMLVKRRVVNPPQPECRGPPCAHPWRPSGIPSPSGNRLGGMPSAKELRLAAKVADLRNRARKSFNEFHLKIFQMGLKNSLKTFKEESKLAFELPFCTL